MTMKLSDFLQGLRLRKPQDGAQGDYDSADENTPSPVNAPIHPASGPTDVTRCDVLILGGGPVGCALALELSAQRVSFRIIETLPARSDKSKALVVQPRTLELLNRHGAADEIVDKGRILRGADIHINGKLATALTVDNLGTTNTDFPLPLNISQVETENFFDECLARRGVTIERPVTALKIIQDERGVTAWVQRDGGKRQVIRAKYVAGCDGCHSLVRHSAENMNFPGEAYPQEFVLCDAHLRNSNIERERVGLHLANKGILATLPLSKNLIRVVASRKHTVDNDEPAPPLEELQAYFTRMTPPGSGELVDVHWLTKFRLHHRCVDRYRDGRLFVVGDAAHIHSPAGGQGMNTGIQDAINLGWKFAQALRMQSSVPQVDDLEDEIIYDYHPVSAEGGDENTNPGDQPSSSTANVVGESNTSPDAQPSSPAAEITDSDNGATQDIQTARFTYKNPIKAMIDNLQRLLNELEHNPALNHPIGRFFLHCWFSWLKTLLGSVYRGCRRIFGRTPARKTPNTAPIRPNPNYTYPPATKKTPVPRAVPTHPTLLAADRLLDTYDAERRPIGLELLEGTDRAFGFMSAPKTWYWVIARNYFLRHILPRTVLSVTRRRAAFGFISEFNVTYAGRSKIVGQAGPGPDEAAYAGYGEADEREVIRRRTKQGDSKWWMWVIFGDMKRGLHGGDRLPDGTLVKMWDKRKNGPVVEEEGWQTVREDNAADNTAAEVFAAGGTALGGAALMTTAPEETAVENTAAGDAAPVTTASEETALEEIAPQEAPPEETTSAGSAAQAATAQGVTAEKTTTAEATTAEAATAETTTAETTTAETTTAETTTAETTTAETTADGTTAEIPTPTATEEKAAIEEKEQNVIKWKKIVRPAWQTTLQRICIGPTHHLVLFAGTQYENVRWQVELSAAAERIMPQLHAEAKVHFVVQDGDPSDEWYPEGWYASPGNKLQAEFGFGRMGGYVLVRPDGHIAFLGSLWRVKDLEEFLARYLVSADILLPEKRKEIPRNRIVLIGMVAAFVLVMLALLAALVWALVLLARRYELLTWL